MGNALHSWRVQHSAEGAGQHMQQILGVQHPAQRLPDVLLAVPVKAVRSLLLRRVLMNSYVRCANVLCAPSRTIDAAVASA